MLELTKPKTELRRQLTDYYLLISKNTASKFLVNAKYIAASKVWITLNLIVSGVYFSSHSIAVDSSVKILL